MENQYDPRQKYTWQPTDKFEFTGEQFGMILNAFRAMISTGIPEACMRILDANNVIEQKMADGVKHGVIKEVPIEASKSSIKEIKKTLRKV
jgi:hypothetical protein